MRSLAFVSIVVALFAVAACTSSGASTAPSEVGGDPASLDGTSWTLTSIGGTTVDVESVPTLVFAEAAAVSGNAGCNQFSGTATIGDGTIDFGALASTRMACVDEAATQLETDYLAALDAATTWSIGGETLTIGGGSELVFASA
jgi:heat shock protein HslJ